MADCFQRHFASLQTILKDMGWLRLLLFRTTVRLYTSASAGASCLKRFRKKGKSGTYPVQMTGSKML